MPSPLHPNHRTPLPNAPVFLSMYSGVMERLVAVIPPDTNLTQAFEAGFPEFWCSGLLCDNCTQTPEAFSALGSLYLVTSPTPRLA